MNDGGVVFPIDTRRTYPDVLVTGTIFHGISFRDYIAVMALQGMIAQGGSPLFAKYTNDWETDANKAGKDINKLGVFLAKSAYHYADAMLTERTKQP